MVPQRAWVATQRWILVMAVVMVLEAVALSGPNVCMVKQKYNITKRIKYRAPMSIRTYEWCFSMPPRCSRWNTEMRDLTRLETEERIAEVAVCCPGYKMKDVSCVPICPNGKTGSGCSKDCEPSRWGPNCVHECKDCSHGVCSPFTGECVCQKGWQGESCETIISTSTTSTTPVENLLTTSIATTKTTRPPSTESALVTTSSTVAITKSTIAITTSNIIKPATATSTILPTAAKTTTQSTTSTRKPNDSLTTVSTPVTFSSTYYDVTSVPTETYFAFKSKESEVLNRKNDTHTATVETSEVTKVTTAKAESKLFNVSTTEKKEFIPITEVIPTDKTTSRVYEITKRTPTTFTPSVDSTRKLETTIRLPTTLKFKPKEIWIRPAQKGEPPVTETKINHELTHAKHKNATKKEIILITTPKTIIVSIIPTSVSYATFKKIALTTASYVSLKNHTSLKTNKLVEVSTRAMSTQTTTATPFVISKASSTRSNLLFTSTSPISMNVSKSTHHTTLPPPRRSSASSFMFVNNTTNSMSRTSNVVSKSNLTSFSTTTAPKNMYPRRNLVTEILSTKPNTVSYTETSSERISKIHSNNKHVEIRKTNATNLTSNQEIENEITNKSINVTNTKTNAMNESVTNTVTDKTEDEEKFHILTEPEHITAVISDKETERSSVDLISVISIAGGVMMAVITVAVIIVMMERCRRPRYDDIRKINDIRMQVMIDSNDIPPPYVRSIFHTPLPDPPSSEKCHYQPISTLDRNLKQFMRPVVVQTISPIMLENFRGILECHYDHLPRRSYDCESVQKRSSVTPSVDASEQHLQRVSLTESAIDALKCEAKLDVIDSTTSEPLYAEIPCWRPPSEHAIEIMNTNGEAITEL